MPLRKNFQSFLLVMSILFCAYSGAPRLSA
jgi:hypothetical protein